MVIHKRSAALKILFIGALFCIYANLALAGDNIIMHGHSGQIEYPNLATSPAYKGWGLDFVENSSNASGNWIHYAIPVSAAGRVRYVQVRIYHEQGADVGLMEVDVWNGRNKVKNITKDADNRPLNDRVAGYRSYSLDLGQYYIFGDGLGISIRVARGTTTASHRINVVNVAAVVEQ